MNNSLSFHMAKGLICVILVLFGLFSCKPSVDDEYIQPDEMEDILYEYHLAEEIARLNGGDSLSIRSLRQIY